MTKILTHKIGNNMTPNEVADPNFPTTRAMLVEFVARRRDSGKPLSLRSYAKHFGVSGAYLSRMLAGKRRIPTATVDAICERVNAPQNWKKLFRLVALYENSGLRDRAMLREQVLKLTAKLPEYNVLTNAAFQIIHRWHHAAIIELTKVKDFDSSPSWISKRLNVPLMDVHLALDRLLRLGYLVEVDAKFVAAAPGFAVPDAPSNAVRAYHRAMLANALNSLKIEPIERRNFQSAIVATTFEKVRIANRMISEFMDELTRTLEDGPQDCVYAVGMHTFPIDFPTQDGRSLQIDRLVESDA